MEQNRAENRINSEEIDEAIECGDAGSDHRDGLLKRKRKKSNYKKINNETRQKLIEMVSRFVPNPFRFI
jgi:hypothetical protein